MALHQLIEGTNGRSLTVLLGDGVHAITDEHPGFEKILDAVRGNESDSTILNLLDPATYIHAKASKVSERFTLAGGTLLFDGDPVEGPLADFIVQIASVSDNKDSYIAYVHFAEKLAQNPSQESRDHLFAFITTHGLTITPEGDVVLYKGVKADGGSIHQGPGIVDGVHMNGSLPNEVGSVLEFPRSQVNADRNVACATDLHAGTFEYASGFARGRLLTVLVNPRDVVSVPSDSANAKVRVSRYTVLEVNEAESAYNVPVLGAEDDDFDDYSDDVDEFFEDDVDENENEPEDTAPAAVPTSEFERKVQDFLVKIPTIIKSGWDRSLAYYVSKHVTAANRDAAREAIRRTGLQLAFPDKKPSRACGGEGFPGREGNMEERFEEG